MSNIPEARRLLREALDCDTPHEHIREALALLDRKKPAFKARAKVEPLSETKRIEARRMREGGMALNDIARRLNTNIGRVSEAINAH